MNASKATAADDHALWRDANRRMIEKTLSEFAYEGLIEPAQDGDVFTVSGKRHRYRWRGRRNRWGQPCVVAGSVVRDDGDEPVTDALSTIHDLLAPHGVSPVTVAHYLRECLNTLGADVALLQARRGLGASAWLRLPAERLQTLLDGHPKAVPCKGRVGWSVDDNRRYGTESAPSFRLHWLGVHRSVAMPVLSNGWDTRRLLDSSCDVKERRRLDRALQSASWQPGEYWLLPVHPWQWQGMIATQYAALLADGRLISLGEGGDHYTPQTSLRTLANVDRPWLPDLKLPVSILNTSAYRGLPARHVAITPALSEGLQRLLQGDPLLRQANTQALAEPASAFVPHPLYHGMDGVPYQFDEMLGAVWRESTHERCQDGEQVLMAAVLHQLDDAGVPLVAVMIEASALDAGEWMQRLFDCTAVPLYHLQACHGLGFIAHGQNLMLRLVDQVPTGILLKDLQGDLFRVDADWERPQGIDAQAWQALPAMPPQHLLHNLWTGLFGSVFRFMASVLHDAGVFDEEAFHRLLAQRLRRYQFAHLDLRERFAQLDLFAPEMPRLSLNRARLAAGYGDSEQRPVHALGPALSNPLLFDHPTIDQEDQ